MTTENSEDDFKVGYKRPPQHSQFQGPAWPRIGSHRPHLRWFGAVRSWDRLEHFSLPSKKQGAVIGWGNFLTIAVNFLIIALVLFLVIRAINRLKKSQPAPAPEPPRSEILLEEIRDALAKKGAPPAASPDPHGASS